MKSLLILAGLPSDVHDRVRAESAKVFVPNGCLVRIPLASGRYNADYAQRLLQQAHDFAVGCAEHDPISVVLSYVDYTDEHTKNFVKEFFPFALPCPLNPFAPDWSIGRNSYNRSLSEYVSYLAGRCRHLQNTAAAMRKYVDKGNLTPLLLPPKNFHSSDLREMLVDLFSRVATCVDPDALISTTIEKFVHRVPYVIPPDDQRRCFSDGRLYFKSPGKFRHGFFRHSAATRHELTCLLAARSRLGATFDYKFHYDCTPTTGGLAQRYPNCHGEQTAPKPTHVNIAPNDYIM
jgi:hypothetical protein